MPCKDQKLHFSARKLCFLPLSLTQNLRRKSLLLVSDFTLLLAPGLLALNPTKHRAAEHSPACSTSQATPPGARAELNPPTGYIMSHSDPECRCSCGCQHTGFGCSSGNLRRLWEDLVEAELTAACRRQWPRTATQREMRWEQKFSNIRFPP